MSETTHYRGRFAPSPTGLLHFGSLVAALGSYLQAKSSNGIWLVRMEDLDPPREQSGAASTILRTLEHFGFEWDEDVQYQSRRASHYDDVLRILQQNQNVFACSCTRKEIIRTARKTSAGYVYPGTCRQSKLPFERGHAIRLKITDSNDIGFSDAIQGYYSQSVAKDVGDFVLKRRDGLYAYQLAVVVDDYHQGITEVVRGMDLLDNTPRQIALQRVLEYPTPNYVHLPLALNATGDKLSKQTFAPTLEGNQTLQTLFAAWHFLGQQCLDPQNAPNCVSDFWDFAIAHWQKDRIPVSEAGYIANSIYL